MKAASRLMPGFAALFLLVACDGKAGDGGGGGKQAETKSGARPSLAESEERRRVREGLEKVTISEVEFESTSAREATAFTSVRIAEIAPDKVVKIHVRRLLTPEMKDENGKFRGGQYCGPGHTYTVKNISAWKLLERIASDNLMTLELIDGAIELRPRKAEGEDYELVPLEYED